jgi:hypothetical protein
MILDCEDVVETDDAGPGEGVDNRGGGERAVSSVQGKGDEVADKGVEERVLQKEEEEVDS